MINAREAIGTHDVLLITLDSLRYDVAQSALQRGLTPELASRLPDGKWERRHTPSTFTYAAHHAFFAGFLPTPEGPGIHPRLFAVTFPGSESISDSTCVFDQPDIVHGLAARGYRTICIGGVGFFNKRSPLGSVLPDMFDESHWSEECGVRAPESTKQQVRKAMDVLDRLDRSRRLFLFVNVSATHQPTCIFRPGATEDSPDTQAAALAHADAHLGTLFRALAQRAPALCVVCSDHGTAFGEGGFHGHRVSHPVIWTVPYAEFILRQDLTTEVV